jgi:hypothetical protein
MDLDTSLLGRVAGRFNEGAGPAEMVVEIAVGVAAIAFAYYLARFLCARISFATTGNSARAASSASPSRG